MLGFIHHWLNGDEIHGVQALLCEKKNLFLHIIIKSLPICMQTKNNKYKIITAIYIWRKDY